MRKWFENKTIPIISLSILFALFCNSAVHGFKERTEKNALEAKEFRINEMYVSQNPVAIDKIINQLPDKRKWRSFLAAHNNGFVYIDPRSGRPVSLIYSFPLIPDTLSIKSNQQDSGFNTVVANEVKKIVMQFLHEYLSLLNINIDEIDEIKAGNPIDYLWQIYITRQRSGIPVRDSNISLTINHGNLVLWGAEQWGDIDIKLTPAIDEQQAVKIGFDFIGDRLATDSITNYPHLEIIPISPSWDGTIGKGYNHILVWIFTFRRESYHNTWEIIVDAHNGKVIAFQDLNRYSTKKMTGAVYPVSGDECCPDGCAAEGTSMPLIDTGFASPNNFTNLSGCYEYMGGTAVTTFSGSKADITDSCGSINESSGTGSIDLGGINGQHDCTIASGHSPGDTFASRTALNEITLINRTAAGWVNYTWLNTAVAVTTNINATCNATDGNAIGLYRSGGGCRNSGEIAGPMDHEWGHMLDRNDANGVESNPSEVLADVIPTIRLHSSCVGRGFWWTFNNGCGQWVCPSNPASQGYNCGGYGDCCMECSGVREADYAKHASGNPHTPINFICTNCSSGSGPCGKEIHCEAASNTEAIWDLAARDLQAAPFYFDKQTAFEVTTRLLYIGSGNVTNWYACNCTNGTSNGCSAGSGYMQWIAADDDDGNINNGTPHMTAIYDAYNRHGIACSTPVPVNSGCINGPTTGPVVTVSPINMGVLLSWNSIPDAAQYFIFRSEGPPGCDFGKIKISAVTDANYADEKLINGKTYYYAIQPVGSNSSCLGPLSTCVSATPVPCSSCAAYRSDSATIVDIGGGDSDAYPDNCESATARVTIENIGSGTAINTQVTILTSEPFINITTPMPIAIGDISAGGAVDTTYNFDIGKGASKAACKQSGIFAISVQSQGQIPPTQDIFGFVYEIDSAIGAVNWPFETNLDGWMVESGIWALSSNRVNPGGSTRSAHSSDALNNNCDSMISPEIEATTTTQLHAPNWYNIEPSGSGYWYDRANFWVVQISTETLISPFAGKLYPTGNFYPLSQYCNQGSDKPGWSGSGTTWGDSVFNLSSYAGQKFQLRVKYMTDANTHGQGIYLDDMFITNVQVKVCDTQSDSCDMAHPPGTVPDNDNYPGQPLTVTKSGADLLLNWGAPGGTCMTADYGIYRGSIPWTSYNHSLLSCSTGGLNSANVASDAGSYYYLVVAQNENLEGSYGVDSFDNQRPIGIVACWTQTIGSCD